MNNLRKAYRTTALIGLWMMASVFLFALFVELVTSNRLPITVTPTLEDAELIRKVFFGAAALEFFLIRFVSNRLLSSRALILPARRTSPYGPDLQRLMTASVLTFAFCESIAILGLILFFVNGNASDFYLFVLISLIFSAVYFPRYGKWEEWMKGRGQRDQ